MEMDSGDQCVPLDFCETPDEPQCHIHSPEKDFKIDDEFELENILGLHRQVSNDIELKLRTTDKNFQACYKKYLEIYRNIISKSRGQAPVAALVTAFVNFGKDHNGLTLPILHNSKAKIRVQPTLISRCKSKIKSSSVQRAGHKLSLKPRVEGRE